MTAPGRPTVPVEITSFGYLHDAAPAAHITLDLRRHFRDPHVDPALRYLTAHDPAVRNAVLATAGIRSLIAATVATVGAYAAGPSPAPVTVAAGCAGGRHRAATVAIALGEDLAAAGIPVTVVHRDLAHAVVERDRAGDPRVTYVPADVTPPELRADRILATAGEGWVSDLATDPTQITDWTARQAAALVPFDVDAGLPRNPAGPTGRIGRNLGRWGENQAADPVVVTGAVPGRRVLLIRRDDCGQWAIPGGVVDPGETAPAALVRELREETGVDLAGVTPTVLARTVVNDPRNTDWAWIATTVARFAVPTPVDLAAGSDALDARWWPADSLGQLHTAIHTAGDQLYLAHVPLLILALAPPPPPASARQDLDAPTPTPPAEPKDAAGDVDQDLDDPGSARPVSVFAGPDAAVIDVGLGDVVGEPPEWQERALCAQTDPEAFFPEKGGSTREAKRICLGCDVRAECLEYALANDERFGIWGGMSERERRRYRRRADAVPAGGGR